MLHTQSFKGFPFSKENERMNFIKLIYFPQKEKRNGSGKMINLICYLTIIVNFAMYLAQEFCVHKKKCRSVRSLEGKLWDNKTILLLAQLSV